MNPQKRMKKKTRQALTTCTFSFVFETVAKMKRSSDIRTLKVNIIAKNTKKLSAELLSPTIKYNIEPNAAQSINIFRVVESKDNWLAVSIFKRNIKDIHRIEGTYLG